MAVNESKRWFLKTAGVLGIGGLLGLRGDRVNAGGQLAEGTGVRLQTTDGSVLTCKVNFVEEPGEWEGCLYWNINSEPRSSMKNTPAEVGRKEYFLKSGDHFYIADSAGKWQEVFFPTGKVIPERPEGFVRAVQEISAKRMR